MRSSCMFPLKCNLQLISETNMEHVMFYVCFIGSESDKPTFLCDFLQHLTAEKSRKGFLGFWSHVFPWVRDDFTGLTVLYTSWQTFHSHPKRDRQHGGFSTIFLSVLSLCPFILKTRISPRNPLDCFELLDFTWVLHLICFLFSSNKTVYFVMIFFFWPSPLFLPLLLPLCCFFFFASLSSFPANDNQHTDGKPVPVSLSPLPLVSLLTVPSRSLIPDHPSSLQFLSPWPMQIQQLRASV